MTTGHTVVKVCDSQIPATPRSSILNAPPPPLFHRHCQAAAPSLARQQPRAQAPASPSALGHDRVCCRHARPLQRWPTAVGHAVERLAWHGRSREVVAAWHHRIAVGGRHVAASLLRRRQQLAAPRLAAAQASELARRVPAVEAVGGLVWGGGWRAVREAGASMAWWRTLAPAPPW
jgi:hypothetical protein